MTLWLSSSLPHRVFRTHPQFQECQAQVSFAIRGVTFLKNLHMRIPKRWIPALRSFCHLEAKPIFDYFLDAEVNSSVDLSVTDIQKEKG